MIQLTNIFQMGWNHQLDQVAQSSDCLVNMIFPKTRWHMDSSNARSVDVPQIQYEDQALRWPLKLQKRRVTGNI